MAYDKRCPALIDPPPYDAELAEWISYRADLQALAHLPGIATFVDEADRAIERLRHPK